VCFPGRILWTAVPTGKVKEVAAMLKAIHTQEDAAAAAEKARQVVEKLRAMKLAKAAEIVANGIGETLSYYHLPPEHWRCLRTNNPLERLMRLGPDAGRLTFCSGPHGGQSKTTPTQQPSNVRPQTQSAINSGHFLVEAEHTLQDAERMLDLGPYARLTAVFLFL
jgi:Transposase, Mutator family